MSEIEPKIKVLFVEDDERLASLTKTFFEDCGLLVTWVTSGPQALFETRQRQFDVILLDLMLPGRSGMEVCRELRTRLDVPIIMVTARREESDMVLGLDAGADDYVTKPFSPRALVAKIQAIVRRARGAVGPVARALVVGPIRVDMASMQVTVSGHEVVLTSQEFAILKALAERAGRVLSREQLLDLAGTGAEEAFERSIDFHISKLRQKLGDDARQPRYLKTIRGSGYMLVAPREE